jgi:hypothetical protein
VAVQPAFAAPVLGTQTDGTVRVAASFISLAAVPASGAAGAPANAAAVCAACTASFRVRGSGVVGPLYMRF